MWCRVDGEATVDIEGELGAALLPVQLQASTCSPIT